MFAILRVILASIEKKLKKAGEFIGSLDQLQIFNTKSKSKSQNDIYHIICTHFHSECEFMIRGG